MTPSKAKQGASGPEKYETWPEAGSVGKDVQYGLPDPAVLARFANEFFASLPRSSRVTENSLPSSAQPVSGPVNAASLQVPVDSAQTTTRPDAPAPTEAELRELPFGLLQVSPFSRPSADLVPAVWVPGVPADLSAASSSARSSFSFLEEARPLFGRVDAPSALS